MAERKKEFLVDRNQFPLADPPLACDSVSYSWMA